MVFFILAKERKKGGGNIKWCMNIAVKAWFFVIITFGKHTFRWRQYYLKNRIIFKKKKIPERQGSASFKFHLICIFKVKLENYSTHPLHSWSQAHIFAPLLEDYWNSLYYLGKEELWPVSVYHKNPGSTCTQQFLEGNWQLAYPISSHPLRFISLVFLFYLLTHFVLQSGWCTVQRCFPWNNKKLVREENQHDWPTHTT